MLPRREGDEPSGFSWKDGLPVPEGRPVRLDPKKDGLPLDAGFDVVVGGWQPKKDIPVFWCIAVCEDGPGALLLAAAHLGLHALVTAMFEVGVSPFVADNKEDTALHIMARLGHTDGVRAVHAHPVRRRDLHLISP